MIEPDFGRRLQAIWDEDPLCWHGATRARNATEYLTATSACLAAMPEYSFPFVRIPFGFASLIQAVKASARVLKAASSPCLCLAARPKCASPLRICQSQRHTCLSGEPPARALITYASLEELMQWVCCSSCHGEDSMVWQPDVYSRCQEPHALYSGH